MPSEIIHSPYPDVEIPDQSLPEFVLARAMQRADKPALIDGPSGRALTYGQLAAGVPRVSGGEVRKVFVVARSNLTADKVTAFVAEHVAPHKKIRLVEFVEEIPRTPAGKILRRVLAERDRARSGTL